MMPTLCTGCSVVIPSNPTARQTSRARCSWRWSPARARKSLMKPASAAGGCRLDGAGIPAPIATSSTAVSGRATASSVVAAWRILCREPELRLVKARAEDPQELA
jgi:hypothetical protein